MNNETYTIYLSEKELTRFDSISPYEYMTEDSKSDIFNQALYPIFNYYKKRTPSVEKVASREMPPLVENKGTLIIIGTTSTLTLFLQKMFPSKNKLYLDTTESLLDVERTWSIISNSRDLKTFKEVTFQLTPWTKLAFAYRLHKVYNLKITDNTTY